MKTRKSNLTTLSLLALFLSCFGFSWSQSREEKIYVDIRKEHINYIDYEDYQLVNGCMERIIFNSSLDELDKWTKSEIDVSRLEEAYFELSWYDSLTFNSLRRAKNLKVLSISFSFPELYQYHDVGGIRAYPLDLSFLYDLPELECLIIQWNGAYFHPEAISSLKKLKYLKTYATAFHPSILRENKALIQIEFEDSEHARVLNRNSIEPFLLDYRLPNFVQFTSENKAYRQFIKQSDDRKFEEWPITICRKNEDGDTLLYWSDISQPNVSWKCGGSSKSEHYGGKIFRSSAGDSIWCYSKYGSRTLSLEAGSGQNYRLKFQELDNEHPNDIDSWFEKNYKNGIPHGFMMKGNYGRLEQQFLYNQGELVSAFYGNMHQLPKTAGELPLFAKILVYRAGTKFHYSGKDVIRMEFFGNDMNDSLHNYLSVPLKEGHIDGNVRAFNADGKEIYNVHFSNGELNGSFFSIDNNHTHKRKYEHGQLVGESFLITDRFTQRAVQESETEHHYMIRKLNSNNQTILLYEYNPKTGLQDCTAWDDFGNLWHTSFRDSNGKQHGDFIYWNKKGRMLNKTVYDHGVQISHTEYPENYEPSLNSDVKP